MTPSTLATANLIIYTTTITNRSQVFFGSLARTKYCPKIHVRVISTIGDAPKYLKTGDKNYMNVPYHKIFLGRLAE